MSENFKRTVCPGKTQNGKLFLFIEFTDGRLSISGVEGPKADGDARGSCGQTGIDPEIVPNDGEGWTFESIAELRGIWDAWHMNDMRPGCIHQRGLDASEPLEIVTHGLNRMKPAGFVFAAEHPRGLLGRKCEECGYSYGSAWLREDVPAAVLDFLLSLSNTQEYIPGSWRAFM